MISANFEASSSRQASFIFNKIAQGKLVLQEVMAMSRCPYTDEWEERCEAFMGIDECFSKPEEYKCDTPQELKNELIQSSWYDMCAVSYQGVRLWFFMPQRLGQY